MTSATDELRRLLDERGVEHYDGTETTLWVKDGDDYRASADERAGGLICLHFWCTTPEQAIAATLGRGTCVDVAEECNQWRCSECGAEAVLYDVEMYPLLRMGRDWFSPRYCPWCGRRCV